MASLNLLKKKPIEVRDHQVKIGHHQVLPENDVMRRIYITYGICLMSIFSIGIGDYQAWKYGVSWNHRFYPLKHDLFVAYLNSPSIHQYYYGEGYIYDGAQFYDSIVVHRIISYRVDEIDLLINIRTKENEDLCFVFSNQSSVRDTTPMIFTKSIGHKVYEDKGWINLYPMPIVMAAWKSLYPALWGLAILTSFIGTLLSIRLIFNSLLKK